MSQLEQEQKHKQEQDNIQHSDNEVYETNVNFPSSNNLDNYALTRDNQLATSNYYTDYTTHPVDITHTPNPFLNNTSFYQPPSVFGNIYRAVLLADIIKSELDKNKHQKSPTTYIDSSPPIQYYQATGSYPTRDTILPVVYYSMANQNYQTMSNQGIQTAENGGYHGAANLGTFNEKKIRSDFVSKVYMVLSVQLLITLAVVAVCVLSENVRQHMYSHGLIWSYSGMGLAILIYFILVCVESARRSFPLNLVLLLVLTLAFSVMVGSLSAHFRQNEVLAAIGATALATVIVMLLAKYSPFDITTCGCALLVISLINLVVTMILIVAIPNEYAKTTSLILAGVGSTLICLYLMYDLQLIMGGRTLQLSEEEYVLASIMLYVDIINLFQYMLLLIGGANRSN